MEAVQAGERLKKFLRIAATSVVTIVLSAHVFPISYGTLTVVKGRVQLRLRVSVHNLHPALEAFTDQHLEMKDEGYESRLLEAYFKDRLELVSPKGKVLRFKMTQQETGIEEMVLTLEAPLKDAKGWWLRDTLLFEQSPAQKNYVTVENNGQRMGLTFDAQHPVLPLTPMTQVALVTPVPR